jgi:AGCS family alanine or glycine:cation symporter
MALHQSASCSPGRVLRVLQLIALTMVFALVSAPSLAQDTVAPIDAEEETVTADDGDSASDDAGDGDSGGASDGAGDSATPIETPDDVDESDAWMKKVDGFFGTFLVDPMETVLFFGFGTEKAFGVKIPIVVLWLMAGAIFFTLRMGFISFRGFWHAIRLTKGDYDDPNQTGEVTHFQALSSALSATVGLGNIAGVAIAIGMGGPGATFWMVLIGLLGMSSKFAECTLGQMYRKVAPDGTVSGGPMHYLRDGLAEMGLKPLGSVLAFVFAILCIGASLGGGNAFQIGQSLDAIRQDVPLLDQYPWIYGLVMAVLAGVVIIGGIKSIGAVASKIVPVMCLAYVAMCLYILGINAAAIPDALASIVAGAFNPPAAFGGILGVMVIGIQRAAFSNEAGIGSAAIAHSAAKTDEPVSEGIVALLEPFIDTVIVCTMTALVIIITGVWDAPEYADLVTGESKSGAALTTAAVSGASGVYWFKYVLYAAVILFAYSTLISWSYYGERSWTMLFGPKSSMAYKILFLVFTVIGSIVTTGKVLEFSDLLILGMALPNILGVALLSGKIKRALDEYWGKYQRGELELDSDAGKSSSDAKDN